MEVKLKDTYLTLTGEFNKCLNFVKGLPKSQRRWIPADKVWDVKMSKSEFVPIAESAGVYDVQLADEANTESMARFAESDELFDKTEAAKLRFIADFVKAFETTRADARYLANCVESQGVGVIEYLASEGAITFTSETKKRAVITMAQKLYDALP